MKTTLTKKFLKFILPLLIFPILLMLVFYHSYLNHIISDETIKNSKIHFENIIHNIEEHHLEIDLQISLQQEYIKNGFPVTIIDKNLNITSDFTKDNISKAYTQYNDILVEYIHNTINKKDLSLTEYKDEQFFIKPIVNSDNEVVAFAISSYKDILSKRLAVINQTFLFILLIIVFITFVNIILTIIFAFNIVSHIKSLTDATKKIASGDLTYKIDSSSDDEIGELGNSFNIMVKKLQLAEANLKDFNNNLLEKVEDELQKGREKEYLLIHQSKMAAMGEMTANIAHQWRQPLNALGLLIQNIELYHEMGNLDEKTINQTIETSNLIIESMSHTIDDFRNFFKPNKEKKTFFISDTINSVLRLVDSSLSSHYISINVKADKGISIYSYSNEFTQVLVNLINNAKDALLGTTNQNKNIDIHAYKKNGYVFVRVSDNGGGIPLSVMDKIFEPYFTTKDEGEGTGIGLYMSKIIIEKNMHGLLKVENSEVGAIFTIELKEETTNG